MSRNFNNTGLGGRNIDYESNNSVIEEHNESTEKQDSAGIVSGLVISDLGSGNIGITTGRVRLKLSNSASAESEFFDVPAVTTHALVLDTITYTYVNYNSTTIPNITYEVSFASTDFNTKILIGKCLYDWTVVHHDIGAIQEYSASTSKIINRIYETEPIKNATGGRIGSAAGLKVSITASAWYSGIARIAIAAFDTNVSSTFSYWYGSTGTFTEIVTQTDLNNSQYDNAGSLANLTANKYRSDYIYLDLDGHVNIILGKTQYAILAQAIDENVPNNSFIPPAVQTHGILLGKYVVQESGATPQEILSSLEEPFTSNPVTDHGSLAGLLDDDHTIYPLLLGRTGDILKIDELQEYTGAAGVTIDSTLIKDSVISRSNSLYIQSLGVGDSVGIKDDGGTIQLYHDNNQNINLSTAAHYFVGNVYTDIIGEKTLNAGVTIDSVLLKDNTVTATTIIANTSFQTVGALFCDTINEYTSTVGVTIDVQCLIKDGIVNVPQIMTDLINEKTSTVGVTIDSVLVKDGRVTNSSSAAPTADAELANKKYVDDQVTIENIWDRAGNNITPHTINGILKVDNIYEETTSAGVTIEGVLLKSDDITAENVAVTTLLTVNGIVEYSTDVGVTIEGLLLEDSVISATDITLKTLTGSGHIYMHDAAGVPVFIYDDNADTFQFSDTLEITVGNTLKTNSIENYNAVEGIDVEGTKFLTNNVNIQGTLQSDLLNEHTVDAGVTIESVLIKDNEITATNVTCNTALSTDTINEKTGAAGVTIDGVILKDSKIIVASGYGVEVTSSGSTNAMKIHKNGSTSNAIISWYDDDLSDYTWYIGEWGSRSFRVMNRVDDKIPIHIDSASSNIYLAEAYGNTVSSCVRSLFIADDGEIGGISSTRESKMNINQMVSSEWLYRVPIKEYQYRDTIRQKDGSKKYLNKPITNEIHIGPLAEDAYIANPHCVYKDKKGKPVGINERAFIYSNTFQIQQLNKKIEILTKRLDVKNI